MQHLKEGGGLTDLALALQARNYKGLSGGFQMMTIAALLIKDKVDMTDISEKENREGMYVRISDKLRVYAVWYKIKQCYIAIRKLTPKECFRLQGWEDSYFQKAQLLCSDTQLYKQAGNGVTVNVIKSISEEMV